MVERLLQTIEAVQAENGRAGIGDERAKGRGRDAGNGFKNSQIIMPVPATGPVTNFEVAD